MVPMAGTGYTRLKVPGRSWIMDLKVRVYFLDRPYFVTPCTVCVNEQHPSSPSSNRVVTCSLNGENLSKSAQPTPDLLCI